MNSFIGIAVLAGLFYSFLIDGTYMKIYVILVVGYTILTQLGNSSRYNNKSRKCNIATWNAPNNPEIRATYEWDIERAESYLKRKQEETGLPLTMTHLVGYCAGHAFKDEADVNGRLRLGNVNSPSPLVLPQGNRGGVIFGVVREGTRPGDVQGAGGRPEIHRGILQGAQLRQQEAACQQGCQPQEARHQPHPHAHLVPVSIKNSLIELVLHTVGYLACAVGISTKLLGVFNKVMSRFRRMRLGRA